MEINEESYEDEFDAWQYFLPEKLPLFVRCKICRARYHARYEIYLKRHLILNHSKIIKREIKMQMIRRLLNAGEHNLMFYEISYQK